MFIELEGFENALASLCFLTLGGGCGGLAGNGRFAKSIFGFFVELLTLAASTLLLKKKMVCKHYELKSSK